MSDAQDRERNVILAEENRRLNEKCKKLVQSNAALARNREELALRCIEAETALESTQRELADLRMRLGAEALETALNGAEAAQ